MVEHRLNEVGADLFCALLLGNPIEGEVVLGVDLGSCRATDDDVVVDNSVGTHGLHSHPPRDETVSY